MQNQINAADALKLAKWLEVAGHIRTSHAYKTLNHLYWDEGLS